MDSGIWTEDLNSTYSIFFSYNTTFIIFEHFVSKFDNLKIYNVEATDDLVGFRITAQSQKTRHVHGRIIAKSKCLYSYFN